LGNAVAAAKGGDVEPRVSKAFDAAITEVQEALTLFRQEAGRHLGVLDYAEATARDEREGQS
jgi:hypothetical protein